MQHFAAITEPNSSTFIEPSSPVIEPCSAVVKPSFTVVQHSPAEKETSFALIQPRSPIMQHEVTNTSSTIQSIAEAKKAIYAVMQPSTKGVWKERK